MPVLNQNWIHKYLASHWIIDSFKSIPNSITIIIHIIFSWMMPNVVLVTRIRLKRNHLIWCQWGQVWSLHSGIAGLRSFKDVLYSSSLCWARSTSSDDNDDDDGTLSPSEALAGLCVNANANAIHSRSLRESMEASVIFNFIWNILILVTNQWEIWE